MNLNYSLSLRLDFYFNEELRKRNPVLTLYYSTAGLESAGAAGVAGATAATAAATTAAAAE